MHESKKPLKQPDLSLSEDDEGARFAWAGFGFRARGFGAAFSEDGEKISTEHIFIKNMVLLINIIHSNNILSQTFLA